MRCLLRLVAYKIFQIDFLEKKNYSPDDWAHIDALFKRENRYARTVRIATPDSPSEKAMWAYYCLLEQIVLNIVNAHKSAVAEQWKALRLGSEFIIKPASSLDDDHTKHNLVALFKIPADRNGSP
ncbi:MAG: hypothetical protein OEV66_05370 [Spirochaetia bacterium]|nr:hypothetical protein [Spirochaetia bacterium]